MWNDHTIIPGILRAQGAARVAPLSLARVRDYETEAMRARREGYDFKPTHAFVAAFPFFAGREAGNLPLYMRGADYVSANKRRLESACQILRRLFPRNHFRPSGNAYPLPAVQAGRLAGLGKIGRHGLLIVPDYGTNVTLGAVFTDLTLPDGADGGYCEGCGACLRACPTHAIREDETGRQFDKQRCRAYISQQETLSAAQTELLRGSPWLSGCDDCQNVCPANRAPLPSVLPEYSDNLMNNAEEADFDALIRRHEGSKKWRYLRRNRDL